MMQKKDERTVKIKCPLKSFSGLSIFNSERVTPLLKKDESERIGQY